MLRISTIFVAVCIVLVAASLGLTLYEVTGVSGTQSAIVALTALTFLILCNAVSTRLRDRSDVGSQLADLSRGMADLARQMAEFGYRLAAVEERTVSNSSTTAQHIQSVMAEINELSGLVKQLTAKVSAHGDLLAVAAAPPAPAPIEKSAAPHKRPPVLATLKSAIKENRIDIFLQPMVTLPQRKVRFYEAVAQLRDKKDQFIPAEEFIGAAESSGLIGRIDHVVMLRCVGVLRRLMMRNKDVSVFCNVAASTLANATTFSQYLDFLEANRALASSLVLEFKQAAFRSLGLTEAENLASLAQLGYRFSIDHVTDLQIEPRELADRGVRFIKVPAALLLDPKLASASDIHPSDLSDLLGRFGIDLIAERIEAERAVIDLLDYDVRFGQGFLFSPPRPLRSEDASATAEPSTEQGVGTPKPSQPRLAQGPNDSSKSSSGENPTVEPPRATRKARTRRAASPR